MNQAPGTPAQPSTGLFGNNPAGGITTGGNPFGANNAANTNTFGANPNPNATQGMGLFSQGASAGTSNSFLSGSTTGKFYLSIPSAFIMPQKSSLS
jgi:hypothetical protein